MKVLTDALKQMLNALAFANAGEYMTQRDKVRVLRQTSQAAAMPEIENQIAASGGSTRHIALYMGSELPAAVMDYVIQTCSRLNNDLTVLTFESKKTANELLQPYEEVLAEVDISMEVVHLSGEPIPSLARYIRKHPEIAFLACKDSGYLGRRYVNNTLRKNAIPVPVVVVATSKADAQVTTQDSSESKVSIG